MKKNKITIVDYGVGNVLSIQNSIRKLNSCQIKVSSKEEDIKSADGIILPGVGAFDSCMMNFTKNGLCDCVREEVQVRGKPILGICVGMQILADFSEENGYHYGLGWIPGCVKKLNLPEHISVPHVGWNNLNIHRNYNLFSENSGSPHFYFDHSYYFSCEEKFKLASCDYGIQITSAVARENIFGVQFHPEKSAIAGLRLFKGFLKMVAKC